MATDSCGSVKIEYLGNGSQTFYTFPFTYIKEDDINVALFDEETGIWNPTTDWVFANPTTIEFTTAPPAPTDPDLEENIRISRYTEVNPLVAQFNPGSAIRASDLNDNFEQLQSAIEDTRCLAENPGTASGVITSAEQKAGEWGAEADNKLASSDAIIARHDVYVKRRNQKNLL